MDRSDWDRKGIFKEVEASKGTENLAAKALSEAINKRIETSPDLSAVKGLRVFDRNTKKERKESFDLDVILADKELLHVEVECFRQSYWDDSLLKIERRWPRGLSILYRKIETAGCWDFFLKISPSAKSFFAVEKDWLLKKYDEKAIMEDQNGILRDKDTGHEIRTCKSCWLVPWDLAKSSGADQGFAMDDWDKLAGMVCNLAIRKSKPVETKEGRLAATPPSDVSDPNIPESPA